MIQALPFVYALSAVATDGTAQIQMGPDKVNEGWRIAQRIVKNTGAPIIPTVAAYRNAVADSFFIDQTINGLFGTSEDAIDLQSTEKIIFVWAGCTLGSTCTVTVRGSRLVDVG